MTRLKFFNIREDVPVGTMVYLDADNGQVKKFRPYSRWERLVRWSGRLLRCRWAGFHQREPAGYLVGVDHATGQDRTVTVLVRSKGVFRWDM